MPCTPIRSLYLLPLLVAIFASQAFAKSGSLPNTSDNVVWFGLGSGVTTFYDPKDQFATDGSLLGSLGIEGRLFKSRFLATLSANGMLTSGKQMDYHFTDDTNTVYADPNIHWAAAAVYYCLGLKIRLIDQKYFAFYVDGGGLIGSLALTYNTKDSDTLTAIGTKAQTGQSNIYLSGNYIESGFDFKPFATTGLRLAARLTTVRSRTIHALDEGSVKWQDAHGYVAFIKGI